MKINIKEYIDKRKKELKAEIDQMKEKPSLLIMQVGDNPASNSYVKGKLKDATEIGITTSLFKVNSSQEIINFLSKMPLSLTYDGVIIQEPSGLSPDEREKALKIIEPTRDVDGFLPNSNFKPCTPKGILNIIHQEYLGNLHGTTVVIIGRGELVGKPLAAMLIEEGATVISCNSKTKNLTSLIKQADILVTAAGHRNLITADMLPDVRDILIIDAGINVDEEGKLHGDCSKELYDKKNILITPVPGGVGLMTRLALMENVVEASKDRQELGRLEYF